MALTQTQIIQSLAEALSWFEKELSWGVAPAELNQLTGRIGELYAAMITRGQMALESKQRGYDVFHAESVSLVPANRKYRNAPGTSGVRHPRSRILAVQWFCKLRNPCPKQFPALVVHQFSSLIHWAKGQPRRPK